MRITSNIKGFVFGFGFIVVLVVGGIAGLVFITNLGEIVPTYIKGNVPLETLYGVVQNNLGLIFLGCIFILLLPSIIKIMRTQFLMRAHNIMLMVADENGLGVHIIAENHTSTPSESNMPGTYTVLHYFIKLQNGKVYMNEVYAYSDEISTKHSGHEGSKDLFGRDKKYLHQSLAILSQKTGMALKFSDQLRSNTHQIYIRKKPFCLKDVPASEGAQKKNLIFFNALPTKGFSITSVLKGDILWEWRGQYPLTLEQKNCLVANGLLLFLCPFESSFDEGFILQAVDITTGKSAWKMMI